ncbi:MAG: hypothetical protein Q9163_004163 [Psora crenata]
MVGTAECLEVCANNRQLKYYRLVATLGSKSGLKKVNRKAILDVNVPQTCEIIIHPEAPMALRLQSNLLYGVSRVYSQQYGYIVSDAQLAQSNMRALLKAVRTSELDPNAGKARPDQLVLEDDPAFLPDLALPGLDIDLSTLDISTENTSRWSSVLSPHSRRSSRSSEQDADGSILGINIPTSDTGGFGGLGGFPIASEHASSAQRNERLGRLLEDEGEAFDVDPGFSIDAEGNVIEEPVAGSRIRPTVGRVPSESGTGAPVRLGLDEGLQQRQYDPEMMGFDFAIPQFNDDGGILPDAEPFPTIAAGVPSNTDNLPYSSNTREDEGSSEYAGASLRRRQRRPRVLPLDKRQELRNADLASWNKDYLDNMFEAKQLKQHHQAPFVAKKNAAFFVMGAGIGGVGASGDDLKLTSPLDIFAGNSMMEMLTGVKSVAGMKRGRVGEDSENVDSEARRIRLDEGDGGQVGRGEDMLLPDDETMMIHGSEGTELGRHAPPSLADDPTYPWNITASALASRHGSSIARGHAGRLPSSMGGFPTSAAGPSSLPGIGFGPLDRRASRITSASPLAGRGRERYSSLEVPDGDEIELLGAPAAPAPDDAYRGFGDEYDSFQLHGPAAGVSTQTAAESQWVRATLDREANNFLEFVKTEIAAMPVEDEEDDLSAQVQRVARPSVVFEDLLPPERHSAIVAAQALHHVLALATKRLIEVRQAEPFGRIQLSLPVGV